MKSLIFNKTSVCVGTSDINLNIGKIDYSLLASPLFSFSSPLGYTSLWIPYPWYGQIYEPIVYYEYSWFSNDSHRNKYVPNNIWYPCIGSLIQILSWYRTLVWHTPSPTPIPVDLHSVSPTNVQVFLWILCPWPESFGSQKQSPPFMLEICLPELSC